jgi:hypothetical protein
MRKIEDECVDCGLPCLGDSCKYKNVERFYCDECGEEEVLYEYDSQELCIECIKTRLTKVEGSDL